VRPHLLQAYCRQVSMRTCWRLVCPVVTVLVTQGVSSVLCFALQAGEGAACDPVKVL
jgi:hypothetical protein